MLRLPNKGTFETLLTAVPVSLSQFCRLSVGPATEPYFATSASHRFDDPNPVKAKRFGVLYAGDSLDVAFAESVIHENGLFVNGRFEVSKADLDRRQLVTFTHPTLTELALVDLIGDALKPLGLNGDISSGDDYAVPQAWAAAIHDAAPRCHGIRYVSRQLNTKFCYALFKRSGVTRAGAFALSDAVKNGLCSKFNVIAV